jgi:hypothetical protein
MNTTSLKDKTMNTTIKPKAIFWISVLISLTTMRVFALNNLPELQMFGGIQPDAWLVPWMTDSIFGILAPFMAYLAFKKNGIKLWGALLIYNGIGAFDYICGFSAELSSPFIAEGVAGAPGMIFGTLLVFFITQVAAIILLLKSDVISHFQNADESVM